MCREKALYFSFVVNVKTQIMKALEKNIIFNECFYKTAIINFAWWYCIIDPITLFSVILCKTYLTTFSFLVRTTRNWNLKNAKDICWWGHCLFSWNFYIFFFSSYSWKLRTCQRTEQMWLTSVTACCTQQNRRGFLPKTDLVVVLWVG